MIDGSKAMKLGLVSKVVPSDDKVMQEAVKVANEMAAPSSRALRGVLRNLRQRQDKGMERTLAFEAESQAQSLFLAQQGGEPPAPHARRATGCP